MPRHIIWNTNAFWFKHNSVGRYFTYITYFVRRLRWLIYGWRLIILPWHSDEGISGIGRSWHDSRGTTDGLWIDDVFSLCLGTYWLLSSSGVLGWLLVVVLFAPIRREPLGICSVCCMLYGMIHWVESALCWASTADNGPTLVCHWINSSC